MNFRFSLDWRKNAAVNTAVLPTVPAPQEFSEAVSSQAPESKKAASMWGTVVEVEEERSGTVKMVSVLFHIIAFQCFLATLAAVFFVILLDYLTGASGFPDFYYLKFFPTLGFVPLIFLVATLVFFLVALKIADGSRREFWTGVLTLLTIPQFLSFGVPMLFSPVFPLLAMPFVASRLIIEIPTIGIQTIGPLFYTFLFFDVVLVVLLIFFKDFRYATRPLEEKEQAWFGLSGIFFALPIVLLLIYAYGRTYLADFVLLSPRKAVPYHVYAPGRFLPGLRFTLMRVTSDRELAGKYNALETRYEVALPTVQAIGKKELPKTVVVKQVGTSPGFDYLSFVSLLTQNPEDIHHEFLAIAKNKTVEQISSADMQYLTFMTADNVLLFLSSSDATSSELLQVAEVLR